MLANRGKRGLRVLAALLAAALLLTGLALGLPGRGFTVQVQRTKDPVRAVKTVRLAGEARTARARREAISEGTYSAAQARDALRARAGPRLAARVQGLQTDLPRQGRQAAVIRQKKTAADYVYAPLSEEKTLYFMVAWLDAAGEREAGVPFALPTPEGALEAETGQNGTAAIGPLAPGRYSLIYPGGQAVVTLQANGAVDCRDPACCGSGEYLIFSGEPRCALTVYCACGQPGTYAFTIQAGGEELTRILGYDPALGEANTPSLALTALPVGRVRALCVWPDGTRESCILDLQAGDQEEVWFGS